MRFLLRLQKEKRFYFNGGQIRAANYFGRVLRKVYSITSIGHSYPTLPPSQLFFFIYIKKCLFFRLHEKNFLKIFRHIFRLGFIFEKVKKIPELDGSILKNNLCLKIFSFREL